MVTNTTITIVIFITTFYHYNRRTGNTTILCRSINTFTI
nr:MAG TPA: hypothetical protein [Bacteriophage sp.]